MQNYKYNYKWHKKTSIKLFRDAESLYELRPCLKHHSNLQNVTLYCNNNHSLNNSAPEMSDSRCGEIGEEIIESLAVFVIQQATKRPHQTKQIEALYVKFSPYLHVLG